MNGLTGETRSWLERLGFTVADEALWVEALTHGSTGAARDYQRLEFLGDRVLGLSIAEQLYRRNGAGRNGGSEGELAQRLNALVSRQACAAIARAIGLHTGSTAATDSSAFAPVEESRRDRTRHIRRGRR